MLLQKRSNYLNSGKYSKAKLVEEELTNYKNKHFDELIVPKRFWCTFQDGKSVNRAIELKKIEIDKFNIEFKNSYCPSDIIWLNRGVKRSS